MRILFLAGKMCQPQCRDEERCAESHSNDHNSALETIQMPSFWEHTRLDVLHVPGVATRVSTRPLPSPARRRHSRRPPPPRRSPAQASFPTSLRAKSKTGQPLLPTKKKRHTETRAATSQCASDVHYLPSCPCAKAGHLNRLQCKVMTSNVICTSVNEGVQPRERRSHPAERRSTSSDDSSNPQFPGPSNS